VSGIPPFVLEPMHPINLLLSCQEGSYKVSQKVKLKKEHYEQVLNGNCLADNQSHIEEPVCEGNKRNGFLFAGNVVRNNQQS
jgi:hypothetical protein